MALIVVILIKTVLQAIYIVITGYNIQQQSTKCRNFEN